MSEVKLAETVNVSKSQKNRISFQAESPAEKIKRGIINACTRDGGRFVKFFETVGILVGAVKMDNDFYFAVLDKDRKVQYFDSTERYSLLKEIPGELSVLNYLWLHDRASLLDIVTNTFMSADIDDVCDKFELLTPIYIRIPQRQSNSKKQMGRKNYKNNTKQKGKKPAVRR
jgi:hypothetical protein